MTASTTAARAAGWVRDHAAVAGEAAVLGVVAAITFAGSASHVLEVGRRAEVSGWHSWSVAGSVEIVAVYAGLEFRRRTGFWQRLVPGLVFAAAAGFLVLANLAYVEGTWAADLLPWASVYAATPPVAFLSLALIVETRTWTRRVRTGRKGQARTPVIRTPSTSTRTPGKVRTPRTPDPGQSGPPAGSAEPSGPRATATPGEDRVGVVAGWDRKGVGYKQMVRDGVARWGVAESTAKGYVKRARTREAETSEPERAVR